MGEMEYRRRDITRTITSDVSAVDADIIFADVTSGAITVTLPPASLGARVLVKKIDSSTNSVTVSGAIDSESSYVISTQYDCVSFFANGSLWHAISSYSPHTEITKTSEITFATTDQPAGKAFTITDFPKHCMIKKVKFRANVSAGQLSAVSALVNDATGLAPADTSLAFDGKSGTFTNGDYIAIDNEIVKINDADPNTSPIVIVRAQKGTTASYLDDNAQITKLNNGFKLQLFKDTNKKPKEMILELSALMTAVGTTDLAVTLNDKKIELSADLKNVDNNDTVLLIDTTSEEAVVQQNTGDVAAAAYDFILYTYDALAAHETSKSVEKFCIYDIPVPYKSGVSTLYGTVQLQEASLAADKTVNIEIIADKYS